MYTVQGTIEDKLEEKCLSGKFLFSDNEDNVDTSVPDRLQVTGPCSDAAVASDIYDQGAF